MVRDEEDPECILGTMTVRWEYILEDIPACAHTYLNT